MNIGEYLPMLTEPEVNNYFSIIFRGEYQGLQNNGLKHKTSSNRRLKSAFVGLVCSVKKQKFQGQHFVPELLDRREIGLPSAGVKINEMIAKNVHTRGFVLVYTCIMQC